VSFALRSSPPDGTYDRDSPYPTVQWQVTLARGARVERDVVVPRTRGEGAEAPTVDLDAVVTDAATGSPLEGARVSAEALRDGLWILTGAGAATGVDGRAKDRLLVGERYRVRVHRSVAATRTHETRQVEVAAAQGRVEARVDLTAVAAPGAGR
jgi:hypothetical protein